MAAAIGTAVIAVKADSIELASGLKKAGDSVSDFRKRSQDELDTLRNRTTVAGAGFDSFGKNVKGAGIRVNEFGRLSGDITGVFDGATGSMEMFTRSLVQSVDGIAEMAQKAGTAKAAVTGLATGLALAAIPLVDSWLSAGRVVESVSDEVRRGAELDARLSETLTSFGLGGGRMTATAGGGAHVSRDRGLLGFRLSDESFDISKTTVDLARLSVALGDVATKMRDVGRAAGRSAEEMLVLRGAAEMAALAARGLEASPAFLRLARGTGEARAGLAESTGAASVGRLIAMGDAATEATHTMGMSAHAAELWRASLVTTHREIEGITVATREAITPMDAHRRRMEAMGGFPARGEILRSIATMHAERAAMERATDRIVRRAGAEESMRLESPIDRARREIERMRDLATRTGDWDRFGRGMRAMISETISPLRALREEWERLAVIAASPIFTRRADAAPPAPAALRPGFAGIGDFLGAVVGRIGGAVGGVDAAPAADVSTARAEAILRAIGGGSRDVTRGPEALERGSVEAVAEVNRLMREARRDSADPIERVRRELELLRMAEERHRDLTRRIADAIDAGILRPAGFR